MFHQPVNDKSSTSLINEIKELINPDSSFLQKLIDEVDQEEENFIDFFNTATNESVGNNHLEYRQMML